MSLPEKAAESTYPRKSVYLDSSVCTRRRQGLRATGRRRRARLPNAQSVVLLARHVIVYCLCFAVFPHIPTSLCLGSRHRQYVSIDPSLSPQEGRARMDRPAPNMAITHDVTRNRYRTDVTECADSPAPSMPLLSRAPCFTARTGLAYRCLFVFYYDFLLRSPCSLFAIVSCSVLPA